MDIPESTTAKPTVSSSFSWLNGSMETVIEKIKNISLTNSDEKNKKEINMPTEKAPSFFRKSSSKDGKDTSEVLSETNKEKFKNYFSVYTNDKLTDHVTKENKFIENQKNQQLLDPEKIKIIHQLLFIMDATGSMGPYIEGTKKEIVKFIDSIKENCVNDLKKLPNYQEDKTELEFQVAVIAYRDFCDKIHFETIDFTTDIISVENQLAQIRADGGGDEPEDVQGAFIHALFGISNVAKKLSWDDNGAVAGRNIIFMADAPAHGKEFNNNGVELTNYDPKNNYLAEWKIIFQEMKKLNITLYSTKLTNQTEATNKMFKSLATDMCKFIEIDISQSVKQKDHDFNHSSAFFGLTRTISEESSSSSTMYYKKTTDMMSTSTSTSSDTLPNKLTI